LRSPLFADYFRKAQKKVFEANYIIYIMKYARGAKNLPPGNPEKFEPKMVFI
jgi:hypothetical protein